MASRRLPSPISRRGAVLGLNDDRPAIVRAAVRQRIRGTLQHQRWNGAVRRQNAEDAAHYAASRCGNILTCLVHEEYTNV